MHVSHLMNRCVVVCRPDEVLVDVAERMWAHDVCWMPVIDAAGRVVGVVSERDACGAVAVEGEPLLVAHVIDGPPPCCHPSDSLTDVAGIMRERRVLRLPVVDEEGRLVGLVAFEDLALELPIGTTTPAARSA